MGFLIWLEETGFAEWIRVSISGYPAMIASHAVGMAVMVGIALTLNMRLLGMFGSIPLSSIHGFMGIAWIGFVVNFLSGAALFTTQATTYITNGQFLLKIGLILAGAATIGYIQPIVGREASNWKSAADVPSKVRNASIVSIVCWVGAILTGRLIAYL